MGRKQAQALLAALICTPLAAQEYEPALIPPQIIGSPQTMTQLNGGDDSTQLVQLAFPFQYYGQTFTSAWVSSNGFVSFQSAAHLCCDGLPMDQAQRNTIYGYWTDLISNPNPYYRMTDTSALFGWYNTTEFGTQNRVTFEIGLFDDGKIQFNFGALANTFHTVSVGITGPEATDNVQLFYGQNVQNLQNQSGILVPSAPEPTPVPVPDAVDPAPDVTPDPTETQTEVLQSEPEQEAVAEEVIVEEATPDEDIVSDDIVETEEVDENQAEDANDPPLDPAELAALAAGGVSDAPTDEEVAQTVEAVGEEAKAAEAARAEQQGPDQTVAVETRRDRNVDFFKSEAIEDADTFSRETVLNASLQNVAFMAQADAQYAEMHGEQTTTETVDTTYWIEPQQGPTFTPTQMTGMATPDEPAWTDGQPAQEVAQAPEVVTTEAPIRSEPVMTAAIDTSPAGQAQQMELLGMQAEMAAGAPTDIGDVNSQDGETMAQLAAVPVGYSAYTQARIPDMPFYRPKDIYKDRRIPDANMALYRMMSGQDRLWDDMVEDQYE
jgi:hypothetical protein